MRASNPKPAVSTDPAALVRARIREKRLYEARFLFRQLADDIDQRERESLQGELSRLCAQIEQMRARARQHTVQGQRDRAEKLYGEIAEIAIDVPGLADEKQAFAGMDSYLARITGQGPLRRPTVCPAESTVTAADRELQPTPAVAPSGKPARWSCRRVRAYWMCGFGLAIVVLLLLSRLLFHSSPRQDAHPVDTSGEVMQAAQQIVIRPIVSSSADSPDGDSAKGNVTDHAAAETSSSETSPASSVFKLGPLQIQDSANRNRR